MSKPLVASDSAMSALVTDPKRASVFADLAGDHNLGAAEAIGDGLRHLLLLGLFRIELHLLALDDLLVAFGGQQGHLARQQVVARVAVGHLHEVAAASEVVDVFSQYHFHACFLEISEGRVQISDSNLKSAIRNLNSHSVT